jgi:predicted secreted protein
LDKFVLKVQDKKSIYINDKQVLQWDYNLFLNKLLNKLDALKLRYTSSNSTDSSQTIVDILNYLKYKIQLIKNTLNEEVAKIDTEFYCTIANDCTPIKPVIDTNQSESFLSGYYYNVENKKKLDNYLIVYIKNWKTKVEVVDIAYLNSLILKLNWYKTKYNTKNYPPRLAENISYLITEINKLKNNIVNIESILCQLDNSCISCIQNQRPPENWCNTGTIVYQWIDINWCQIPPLCVENVNKDDIYEATCKVSKPATIVDYKFTMIYNKTTWKYIHNISYSNWDWSFIPDNATTWNIGNLYGSYLWDFYVKDKTTQVISSWTAKIEIDGASRDFITWTASNWSKCIWNIGKKEASSIIHEQSCWEWYKLWNGEKNSSWVYVLSQICQPIIVSEITTSNVWTWFLIDDFKAYKNGNQFYFSFKAAPSTGYSWGYTINNNNVKNIEKVCPQTNPNIVWASCTETYTFITLEPGNTDIKFSYTSPSGTVTKTRTFGIKSIVNTPSLY